MPLTAGLTVTRFLHWEGSVNVNSAFWLVSPVSGPTSCLLYNTLHLLSTILFHCLNSECVYACMTCALLCANNLTMRLSIFYKYEITVERLNRCQCNIMMINKCLKSQLLTVCERKSKDCVNKGVSSTSDCWGSWHTNTEFLNQTNTVPLLFLVWSLRLVHMLSPSVLQSNLKHQS